MYTRADWQDIANPPTNGGDELYQKFAEIMFKSLKGLEFIYVSRKHPSETGYTFPPCCQYSKMDGSLMYMVNIYDCDCKNLDIAGYRKRLSESTIAFAEENHVNGVAVFEIFTDSDGSFEINETENGEVIFIEYFVNLTEKSIRLRKNQPTNEQNINDIIKFALEGKVFELPKIEFTKDRGKITRLSYSLITLNILLFLVSRLILASYKTDLLIEFGALNRNTFFEQFQIYRVITYMFIHGGFAHISNNIFWLFIIGSAAEKTFGSKYYLLIYFMSGIAAGLVTIIFQDVAIIGASGALFGLIGAMMVYSYINKRTNFGFNFMLLLMISIVSLLSGFFFESVGNLGHITGLVAGLTIGYLLCKRVISTNI